MSTDVETCAYCPRLCRHVCPVTVATGREAATPTAMMTVLHLMELGSVAASLAAEAASLCLGCGACTAHCKYHVPVAEILRPHLSAATPALPVPTTPASGTDIVFHPCHGGPRHGPDQLACCGVREGFPIRQAEAARAVAEENVRRFAGRTVACADLRCGEWLEQHGARIVRAPEGAA